jgi:uncharacterized protein (TIGR02301 family)
MRMTCRVASMLLAVTMTAAPARAQTPPAPVSPYAQQLMQLSTVLGGAHYLRILCQGRADQRWRDYMKNVINREPNYRNQLIEGFNRGYRDLEARYPACDATATASEGELRAQGLRIANGLSVRRGAAPEAPHDH